jgi:hypothetical protein
MGAIFPIRGRESNPPTRFADGRNRTRTTVLCECDVSQRIGRNGKSDLHLERMNLRRGRAGPTAAKSSASGGARS